jgi:hypothetical protein
MFFMARAAASLAPSKSSAINGEPANASAANAAANPERKPLDEFRTGRLYSPFEPKRMGEEKRGHTTPGRDSRYDRTASMEDR